MFRRKKAKFTVTVNLDPVPGTFHTVESAQKSIQAILNSMISHYEPHVEAQQEK